MTTLRLLVVDDDPIVRMGLRLVFRTMPELELVAEASDGSEVIELLSADQVDVVLMDVRMRTVNGITAARAIRNRFPKVRVVLMSTLHNDDFSMHAKNIGGDFIPKSASPETFRRTLIGQACASEEPDSASHPDLSVLTPREMHVARLVAEGNTNDEIAQQSHLSINSVKTYVSRALAKTKLNNRVQLANAVNDRNRRLSQPLDTVSKRGQLDVNQ